MRDRNRNKKMTSDTMQIPMSNKKHNGIKWDPPVFCFRYVFTYNSFIDRDNKLTSCVERERGLTLVPSILLPLCA